MHPTSFTKHSSHKVTNEMYIIKTKHKSSVNKKIVSFKVECILWSQSLQVNNMKITFLIEICAHEFIYLQIESIRQTFSHKSVFKGWRHFKFKE